MILYQEINKICNNIGDIMSKILGIIAEYNPFHNGHLLHLEESKRLVNPDYTVCIMSGNFVQRRRYLYN